MPHRRSSPMSLTPIEQELLRQANQPPPNFNSPKRQQANITPPAINCHGVWMGEELSPRKKTFWYSNHDSRTIIGNSICKDFFTREILRRAHSYLDENGRFLINSVGNVERGEIISRREHYSRLDHWYDRMLVWEGQERTDYPGAKTAPRIDINELREKRRQGLYELRVRWTGQPYNGPDWYGDWRSDNKPRFGSIRVFDKRLRTYLVYGLMDRPFITSVYWLLRNIGYDLRRTDAPYRIEQFELP